MRLGFYTFGGTQIGMGHIYRCLSLAKAAQRKFTSWEISFFVEGEEIVVETIRDEHGYECITVQNCDNANIFADIVVVDRLNVPVDVNTDLKTRCACLISIDDTGPGHYAANFAVNPLYQCITPRPPESETIDLDGLAYAILDEGYRDTVVRPVGPVENIFLAQGSTDSRQLLPSLLAIIGDFLNAHPETRLHIVTGPAFVPTDAFLAACKKNPNQTIWHQNPPGSIGLKSKMDLAVTGAGVTAFELAALGIPSVIITGVEKELETARELENAGAAINMGLYHSDKRDQLLQTLESLESDLRRRETLSQTARSLVDGHGADRLLDAACNFVRKPIIR
jgi:spore coat polysaccharide biosynthesis predicted glycosyltransferase SpsG